MSAKKERAKCFVCKEAISREVKRKGPTGWKHDEVMRLGKRKYDHEPDPNERRERQKWLDPASVKEIGPSKAPDGSSSVEAKMFYGSWMLGHAVRVAKKAGVDIRQSDGYSGHAYADDGYVTVPTITGLTSYFIALHEIGHMAAKGHSSAKRLEQESIAWRWALNVAGYAPTRSVKLKIAQALRSYDEWAKQKQGYRTHPPHTPGEGSDFWQLIAEMEGTDTDTQTQAKEA